MNVSNDVRVSVAMAVYNGAEFIDEQIESILDMLSSTDELVISYEKSRDETLSIIQYYEKIDKRVRVVYDEGASVESNFNNAVQHCKGDFIFFADQDDVWISDKINKMVSAFENDKKIMVVICDGFITDENLEKKETLFGKYNISTSGIRNFIKGTYLGCQMAMRKDLAKKVWPVSDTPALPHDLWTGVMGDIYGKVVLIDEKLILHRLHSDNYSNTSKLNLAGVIKNRLFFGYKILQIIIKNYGSIG